VWCCLADTEDGAPSCPTTTVRHARGIGQFERQSPRCQTDKHSAHGPAGRPASGGHRGRYHNAVSQNQVTNTLLSLTIFVLSFLRHELSTSVLVYIFFFIILFLMSSVSYAHYYFLLFFMLGIMIEL
jgi:hypothetical protein